MRMLCLGLALWNTLVAAVNVTVLPLFVAPEAMIYMTPISQFLPVAIPFAAYALTYRFVRRFTLRALGIA